MTRPTHCLSSPMTVCLLHVSWAMEAPLLSQVEQLLGYYCCLLRASMSPLSIVLLGIFHTCVFVIWIALLALHQAKSVWRLMSKLVLFPLVAIKTWACLVGAVGPLLHKCLDLVVHKWVCDLLLDAHSCIEFLIAMFPHVPGHVPQFLYEWCCPLQAWFPWFSILPIFSWWLHHCCMSHPPIILSHSIHLCSSANVSSMFAGGVSLFTHHSNCDIISFHISKAVPWSFNHWLSFCILRFHCAWAVAAGHWLICILSSILAWQSGHTGINLWPLLTIFSMCEVSGDMFCHPSPSTWHALTQILFHCFKI